MVKVNNYTLSDKEIALVFESLKGSAERLYSAIKDIQNDETLDQMTKDLTVLTLRNTAYTADHLAQTFICHNVA
jgi:hypothetical protein